MICRHRKCRCDGRTISSTGFWADRKLARDDVLSGTYPLQTRGLGDGSAVRLATAECAAVHVPAQRRLSGRRCRCSRCGRGEGRRQEAPLRVLPVFDGRQRGQTARGQGFASSARLPLPLSNDLRMPPAACSQAPAPGHRALPGAVGTDGTLERECHNRCRGKPASPLALGGYRPARRAGCVSHLHRSLPAHALMPRPATPRARRGRCRLP